MHLAPFAEPTSSARNDMRNTLIERPWAYPLLLGLLAIAYTCISRSFPFYFIWDMDWISTIDSVLIQSNQIPRHVNHTGFGMYLLFGWTHRIATWLGWVSLTGLDSLKTAANPVLASAQLTDFFRLHSPLTLTVIVACSFSLVSRLSPSSRDARAGRLWATLAVLLLGLQDGLFYQAAMVRTGTLCARLLGHRADAWSVCSPCGRRPSSVATMDGRRIFPLSRLHDQDPILRAALLGSGSLDLRRTHRAVRDISRSNGSRSAPI